jgi:ABC-2 type transport system ATP-binding protein/lipopolysaccharide transport system ATP-binding protein
MASIRLSHVSVFFPIYDAYTRSLKNKILPASLGGRIGTYDGKSSYVEALRDINLDLKHGDRLGLVGHNGAGKSTLLRVLAGLYEPCAGEVEIAGHIAPLFDISLGMDPEATGFENIFLRGIFLGLSRREISEKVADIAEFTELGEYLSFPIRTYSAGMRIRLAFAVSTAIKPDIILLDEGIGAGDASFLEKAESRLEKFTSQAGIVVLASHSDFLIKKMCTTALLMDRGTVIAQGNVDDILLKYTHYISTKTE